MQFEGILSEAAPCVAYALVDLEGQLSIVVDVLHKVFKLVRWVVFRDPMKSALAQWRMAV